MRTDLTTQCERIALKTQTAITNPPERVQGGPVSYLAGA